MRKIQPLIEINVILETESPHQEITFNKNTCQYYWHPSIYLFISTQINVNDIKQKYISNTVQEKLEAQRAYERTSPQVKL